MKQLAQCPVKFNQEEHTYTLDGKSLSGVTAIVAWMFPRTYDTIPEEVLLKAARRGTDIHETIELYESMGIDIDYHRELQEYKRIKFDQGFGVTKTEYLVSDNKNIASSIDLVFDDYELCDIKGTSEVHLKNLCLQLSIYALLFEQMNPGLKVPRLSCIWLPKENYSKYGKYVAVPRLSAEDTQAIINAYVNGDDPRVFDYLFENLDKPAIQVSDELIAEMGNQIKLYKQAEQQYKAIKSNIEKLMKDHNVTKWETDHFKASLGQDSVSAKFDVESFKKDYPELYDTYLIETKRKGTFRLT